MTKSHPHQFVYISEVVHFVEIALKCSREVLVKQGKTVANGKSLMGLYSLDLLLPVSIEFDAQDEHLLQSIFKES